MADSHDDSSDPKSVGRRDFFRGAALGAAGLAVTRPAAAAEFPSARPGAVVPTHAMVQAELGAATAQAAPVQAAVAQAAPAQTAGAQTAADTATRPASDFMVDVLKKVDLEYAAIKIGRAHV